MNPEKPNKGLGCRVLLALVLLLIVSRFVPVPWAVTVADDWYNLARSASYESHAEAVFTGLQDPNRPLSMAAVELTFRLFGTDPMPWTIISMITNSLLVILVALLGYELTEKRSAAFLMGAFLALTPNLVETYHWSTQIVNEVTCALIWYAACGWLWVKHSKSGGLGVLVLSALCYLVGLFSYEAGLFLPAAFIALLPWRTGLVKNALRLLPFALVAAFYAVWRVTDALGTNESWFYPAHMKVGITLGSIIYNTWQFVLWWVGDHMLSCIHAGWDGFMQLGVWTRRVLLLINAGIVAGLGIIIARLRVNDDETDQDTYSAGTVLCFGLLWLGAAVLPLLISYTASRLNILPAIGLAILAIPLVAKLPVKAWFPLLAVPLWISLASNQGTTEQYRQAGAFNERLYKHLSDNQAEWLDKEIIVFDTQGIRHRQTGGLLKPATDSESVWAQHGNALLFRGFVPRGMMELVSDDRDCPVIVVHDVENSARLEDGTWHWHARFDPSDPRTTPEKNAYYIDLFSATRD